MDVTQRDEIEPFVTTDGSEIRELLAYRNSGIRNQSLAEATLPVGRATKEHYHPKAEEIYFILKGSGRMKIESDYCDVRPGCSIAIPPGKRHKIWNVGKEPLVFLCCCAPCYEHADTVLTEEQEPIPPTSC